MIKQVHVEGFVHGNANEAFAKDCLQVSVQVCVRTSVLLFPRVSFGYVSIGKLAESEMAHYVLSVTKKDMHTYMYA